MRTHGRRLMMFGGVLAALGVVGAIVVVNVPSTSPRVDPLDRSLMQASRRENAGGAAIIETVGDEIDAGDSDADVSWDVLYRASADYFSFAETVAEAAMAGDARAQYVLSQVLMTCDVQVRLVSAMGRESLDANLEAYLASFPKLPVPYREKMIHKVRRCEGFFDGSPLGLPEEANSHEYWLDKAVTAGDPLAVMDRAITAAVGGNSGADAAAREELRVALLDDVRVAVISKDAAALAKIGLLYSQPSVARDQSFQGPAWRIAACELGYDCSNANPEMGDGCAEVGLCNGALTLSDIMRRDLGVARFAEIYAASQDIVYKVKQGDWQGLQEYLDTRL